MTGEESDRSAPGIDHPDKNLTPGISIDLPDGRKQGRSPVLSHVSSPAYQSPLRQHRRNHSTPRKVKETLNARSEYTNSEDDGQGEHRINQYLVKQEIGRGSFGSVHLAVDQFGQEFAVKEVSKSRLRKRAQSNILRRPHGVHSERRPGHLAAGVGLNSPLHRHSASDIHDHEEGGNPLYLIQAEIAIMKKLNHDNLVSLIEVLDDPEEDSLYMVLEMCKKGVIMKVGLGERADPYSSEQCRHWFRDLMLGIEYLHAQGIVHRDIKPDNLLLTDDDVLKIVDFGVSEMFEKQSEMLTAKSAGSPAFLPPELCVVKHGDISGRAADVWSMGVSLYCLRFGKIPFERTSLLDLYEAIKTDQITFDVAVEPEFVDLMHRLLEKNPSKRVTMPELREHPWITRGGTDPLLSTEENTADLVEPPTQAEMESAITSNFRQLLTVMKAVKRFKDLTSRKRPRLMEGIFGGDSGIVQPPGEITPPISRPPQLLTSQSVNIENRLAVEGHLAAQGIHRELHVDDLRQTLPARGELSHEHGADLGHKSSSPPINIPSPRVETTESSRAHARDFQRPRLDEDFGEKGQAHDPSNDAPVMLNIGPGSATDDEPSNVISESPPATDINIYEMAYRNEVDRILEAQGSHTKVYLTNGAEGIREMLEVKRHIGNHFGSSEAEVEGEGRAKIGWAKLLEKGKFVVASDGSEKEMPNVHQ